MKNKTGLSFLLSFLLLIFFQINAFAEQPQFSFSFTPQAGFLNGKIIENVWYANEKITPTSKIYTPADKMSRLDWYMENVPFVGAELDFLFNNKYSFLFSFKNAFAGDCGKMEDFDWLNPIDWPKDPADELTNYSKHTNILHNYTQATINFGRHFYLGKNTETWFKRTKLEHAFGVG